MKLLGFVNLFLPLVKGLLGVLGGLGKGLAGLGKALLGVAGVASAAAGFLRRTLFEDREKISLETTSLVVRLLKTT